MLKKKAFICNQSLTIRGPAPLLTLKSHEGLPLPTPLSPPPSGGSSRPPGKRKGSKPSSSWLSGVLSSPGSEPESSSLFLPSRLRSSFVNLSFYRFFPVAAPDDYKLEMAASWLPLHVRGRAYVANNGVNAQLSVPLVNYGKFTVATNELPGLQGVYLNHACDKDHRSPALAAVAIDDYPTPAPPAFFKLHIRVRPLVAGAPPKVHWYNSPQAKSHHLPPLAFAEALKDPSALVFDLRNHYEYEIGRFDAARILDAETFKESLPMLEAHLETLAAKETQAPVLLYCTGGIRCETVSDHLAIKGYNVKQLDGGLVRYVKEVHGKRKDLPEFKGRLFVFDEARSVKTTEHAMAKCHQCGTPHDSHTNCANKECWALFVQCPTCATTHSGCCTPECAVALKTSIERQQPSTAVRRHREEPPATASSSMTQKEAKSRRHAVRTRPILPFSPRWETPVTSEARSSS